VSHIGNNAVKAENRLHFGVSILETSLPAVIDHQSELRNYLLALRAQQQQGIQRSNQRGWHSPDDLFNQQEPVIQQLCSQVFEVGSRLIRHAEQFADDEKILLTSMWANINDFGAWNAPHAHLPCEWSGVVYIDVNETPQSAGGGIHDGDILFFDPITVGAPYRPATTISYTPKIGTLYMFPSYLMHMVAPHYEEKPRISVAFNFRVARNLEMVAR